MTHPPGTIVLPNAVGIVRYVQFAAAMFQLEQPEGTTISIHRSASVAENTNAAIREMHGEWAWLIADDHVFAPDILTRLLDRQVDVVVPVCCKRTPPYPLVLYREHGTQVWGNREYPAWKPFRYDELPDRGLFTVDAAGSAGMLIRRRVLDEIGEPWFENSPGAAGNEDVLFCAKARAHGFEIHVDSEVYLGHLGEHCVWPDRVNGWRLDLGNQHEVVGRDRAKEPVAAVA